MLPRDPVALADLDASDMLQDEPRARLCQRLPAAGGGDMGRLYLVDVEKNTFAFQRRGVHGDQGAPCCYCKRVM